MMTKWMSDFSIICTTNHTSLYLTLLQGVKQGEDKGKQEMRILLVLELPHVFFFDIGHQRIEKNS